VIITVPHGGYGVPDAIPDRIGGCHEHDLATQELARELLLAFESRHGGQPHMIIALLARVKLDMNRGEEEAFEPGCDAARTVWQQFHGFVARAKAQVLEQGTGLGLVVDLHGQSHDPRHQLGYILNRADFCCADADMDADVALGAKCSLRAACHPGSEHNRLSQVVRGPTSLGAILESRGCPCVPSPSSPEVGKACECYFNGGYNTRTGASIHFIALQIESAVDGVRDTPSNIAKFAENLADSLMAFTALHLPPRSTPLETVRPDMIGAL
jgi:hypothetical protein